MSQPTIIPFTTVVAVAVVVAAAVVVGGGGVVLSLPLLLLPPLRWTCDGREDGPRGDGGPDGDSSQRQPPESVSHGTAPSSVTPRQQVALWLPTFSSCPWSCDTRFSRRAPTSGADGDVATFLFVVFWFHAGNTFVAPPEELSLEYSADFSFENFLANFLQKCLGTFSGTLRNLSQKIIWDTVRSPILRFPSRTPPLRGRRQRPVTDTKSQR